MHIHYLPLVVLLAAAHATADVIHGFNFKLPDDVVSTTFVECSTVNFITFPLNTSTTFAGTPPYYLTAAEIGGIPTVDFIGTDPQNLQWTVNHKAGAQFLLEIHDSQGLSAGVGPTVFSVSGGAGSSSSCLPTPPSNLPVLQANVTTDNSLKTCDPWGLAVHGGAGPYNITLFGANVGVTNVTLGQGNDVFTYINREPPDTKLLAMIIDANGNFGQSTPLIKTTGSKDTTCTGLVSSASTQVQVSQEAAEARSASAAANKKKQVALAVGLTILFVVLFLLAGLALWWWRRRRAQDLPLFNFRSDAERAITPAVLIPSAPASQADLHAPMAQTDAARPVPAALSIGRGYSFSAASASTSPTSVISGPLDLYSRPTTMNSPLSGAGLARLNSSSPMTLSARQRKALEAGVLRPTRSLSGPVGEGPSGVGLPVRSQSASAAPGRERQATLQTLASLAEENADGSVIIQHADAGTLELPPPYLDRRDSD